MKSARRRMARDPLVLLHELQFVIERLIGPRPTVHDRLNCAAVLRALADTLETDAEDAQLIPPPPPLSPPRA
ncbi:MAG TPA: hypothetical protein PKC19_15330 [Roseiflexaceae bacterium]|nr:hypothetical protein [Roseiflexaceae bacterium]